MEKVIVFSSCADAQEQFRRSTGDEEWLNNEQPKIIRVSARHENAPIFRDDTPGPFELLLVWEPDEAVNIEGDNDNVTGAEKYLETIRQILEAYRNQLVQPDRVFAVLHDGTHAQYRKRQLALVKELFGGGREIVLATYHHDEILSPVYPLIAKVLAANNDTVKAFRQLVALLTGVDELVRKLTITLLEELWLKSAQTGTIDCGAAYEQINKIKDTCRSFISEQEWARWNELQLFVDRMIAGADGSANKHLRMLRDAVLGSDDEQVGLVQVLQKKSHENGGFAARLATLCHRARSTLGVAKAAAEGVERLYGDGRSVPPRELVTRYLKGLREAWPTLSGGIADFKKEVQAVIEDVRKQAPHAIASMPHDMDQLLVAAIDCVTSLAEMDYEKTPDWKHAFADIAANAKEARASLNGITTTLDELRAALENEAGQGSQEGGSRG